jgi:hypothetical protein
MKRVERRVRRGWIWGSLGLILVAVVVIVSSLSLHGRLVYDLAALPMTSKSAAVPKAAQQAKFAKTADFLKQKLNEFSRAQTVAAAQPVAPNGNGRVVTYAVAEKGSPSSNLAEFKASVAATLSDPRGWTRADVTFQEVDSGGMFTLWLSEPQLVPSFSSGCSAEWSCRVGRNVIINDLRWRETSLAWQASGGSVADYRHMVINHEVGHFLGHMDNEQVCSAPGAKAPLMQEQSMDLRGCTFNPWPLDSELWVRF